MIKILTIVSFVFLSCFAQAQYVGENVKAELEGKWYDAELLEFKIGLYKIKLSTDTVFWTTKERIKFSFNIGDTIKAEWLGSWYPAKIIEQKGDMYKVDFFEMSSEIIEWVKTSQMKVIE